MGRLGACLDDYELDLTPTTPSGLVLQAHQRRAVSFIRAVSPQREGAILAGDMGTGKAQDDRTPVPVPQGGTKRLCELRPSDRVFGSDGTPTKVLSVHPQGERAAYTVTFSDHSATICSEDHLWHIITPCQKHRGQYGHVRPLAGFMDDLHDAAGNRKYQIPTAPAVTYDARPAVQTPIAPYLLGLLLSHGEHNNHTPILHVSEQDVQKRAWALLPKDVTPKRVKPDSDCSWRLSSESGENPLTRALRDPLGLWGSNVYNKFIPDGYLYGTEQTRLELLQGIIDGDGDVSADGICVTFNTSSRRLKDDVVQLVQSLGGMARSHLRSPTYTYKGEQRQGAIAYRVNVRMPTHLAPVSSDKHRARWKPTSKYQPTRAIADVEYVGRLPMTCIRVAAQDGLYLTNNFIVTHNTVSALQALHLDGYLGRPGIVCGPKLARNAWCGEHADPQRFFGLKISQLEGRKLIDPAELEKHRWWFCHYDILAAWQPWLFSMLQPASIVLDESHLLMHAKAGRSKAALQVSMIGSVDRRILLTGTPIPNNRLELWNQLACAQPRQWGSTRHDFGARYCAGQRRTEEEGGNWEYKGESNTRELQARLAGTLLRYTRYDILDQLPNMRRHVIEAENLDPELFKEYHAARRDVVSYLRAKGELADNSTRITLGSTQVTLTKNDQAPGAVHLVGLNTMIGLLSKMKKDPALDAVVDIMEAHDQLVVFTWRIDTARWLYKRLAQIAEKGDMVAGGPFEVFGPVSGKMPQEERRELARKFAAAPRSIYVATRGAAGISINELAAASACLFVDLYWNTASLTQAESRVHRSGNPHKDVDIYFLVAKNTIDALMLQKLQDKAEAMTSLSEGDTIGLSLVRDLSPTNSAADGSDLDVLCAALVDMED